MKDSPLIGFIGVGVMGRPMAGHLLAKGHRVMVYDLSADAMEALAAAGARKAADVRDLCNHCEVVFTSLPSPAVFSQVMLGEGGIVGAGAVRVAIDLSTVGPRATQAAAAGLRARGIELVDAPVSGGAAGAREARLAVMAAGAPDVVAEVRTLLEVFGRVFVVGETPGQAQLLKLLNNMLSATAFAVTAEAYVAGVKGGLDPQMMMEVINLSSGRSAASQEKFMRQVLPRSFDFGFPISSVCKDIGLAIEECEALGVPMWVGSQARQVWNFAAHQDGARRDMTELVTYIEQWAGAQPPEPVRKD
jgi:2-hydroxy-3-oxopropionate reductase